MKEGDVVYHKTCHIPLVLLDTVRGDGRVRARYWSNVTGRFELIEVYPEEITVEAPQNKSIQWEYKVVPFRSNFAELEDTLNSFGKAGYAIISVNVNTEIFKGYIILGKPK